MHWLRVAAAFALTVLASQAQAWNERGHLMVAAVAWDLLTLSAQARAAELLKLNPDYDDWVAGVSAARRDQAFVKASVWADDIKSRSGYRNDGSEPSGPDAGQNIGYADMLQHRYWHYIDLPFSNDGTPLIQPPSPNAETQIVAFRRTLRSTSASDEVKSYDLVWLIHLVGDVHQPLHATARFSSDFPDGDAGGNGVKLCASPCRNNLHSLWDGALGSGTSINAAINAARNLDPAPDSAASRSRPRTWIEESFEIAQDSVYIRSAKAPGRSRQRPLIRPVLVRLPRSG